MTTIGDFNKTIQEFLNDLSDIYPEHKGIIKEKIKYEVGIRSNCRLAFDNVMPYLLRYSKEIIKKDDSVLESVNHSFQNINLVEIWNKKETTLSIKETIWKYLNTILTIGTYISFAHNSF